MKISNRKNSDGVALIIAMIALTVLSILAAGLWIAMKVETRLAQNSDSDQQLLWLGRSGVELARYVLSEQASIAGEPYDSLNQIWAGGPGGPGETNSALAGLSLDDYPVGDGTVSVKIVDLDRKVNINTASPLEIQQTLTTMGVDANDISVVSDSILDWIDSDDAQRPAGAESDYYQTLTPAYYAKNAPIDDLSELLLVKGVTPEMYWGGSATNYAPSPFHHELGFGGSPDQPPDYPFGLKDIFTPISSGTININTADTNVLEAVLGIDPTTAATIILQRAGPDGVDGTEDDTPIRNAQLALQTAGVNPSIINRFGGRFGTRSTTFEVHITAKIGDYSRDFTAVLYRASGTDIQILSFYWK